MNVPIMGWGMWDYKAGIRAGRSNTRVGFGSLGRPTNVFGISKETVAALGADETFNKARGKFFVAMRFLPQFRKHSIDSCRRSSW
ncbi:hypothetical protein L596_010940 [Steinernema carpocapsae]|uniref:Uncharacterized protein n=1 Tax=Steinernema carpocapsae TaxID=34508 RepID=A0A4U5PK15_STECR|nr:hypothetical protein L596_010940 [Steinernema carpocapsae]